MIGNNSYQNCQRGTSYDSRLYQGREVFLKQQQALELHRDYEFIKEELERLDVYMQALFNKKLNKVVMILDIR